LRPLTFRGVALALIAIALVSRPPQNAADLEKTKRIGFPPGFGLALLAGISVGIFFLSLARTGTASGMWPLIAARISSIGLFSAIALLSRRTLRMSRIAAATVTTGGALDMAANALYMIAARVGPLSIVVTLASLYPASTVFLARFVLRERLGMVQIIGIASALIAVVIIVASTA